MAGRCYGGQLTPVGRDGGGGPNNIPVPIGGIEGFHGGLVYGTGGGGDGGRGQRTAAARRWRGIVGAATLMCLPAKRQLRRKPRSRSFRHNVNQHDVSQFAPSSASVAKQFGRLVPRHHGNDIAITTQTRLAAIATSGDSFWQGNECGAR
jgi:hypothetical protein